MTNQVYEVRGEIQFTPEDGKGYVVRGKLSEAYSAVWLEEGDSGNVVGTKFEKVGSTALGFFEK